MPSQLPLGGVERHEINGKHSEQASGTKPHGAGAGGGGGGVGGVGGVGGAGGGEGDCTRRGPQSVQSVPMTHTLSALPGPPSWQ